MAPNDALVRILNQVKERRAFSLRKYITGFKEGIRMKIVVVKAPKSLVGILKAIFGVR